MLWKLVNPKDLTIREPNVEIPPLAILLRHISFSHSMVPQEKAIAKETHEIAIVAINQIQVLRSRATSLTWSHRHS
jgi:hypothetical protein